ncbi:PspC domain-containing protein [Edaphobacter sp.]|uniref:PspC domain-containing protein n=1 Tax=Edaphobacter sp. TaxID=1934404 RepID=UPI002DB5B493|nr:PspC domain-containing protein [Edaphobacter sp.]HEU5341422.1 PspC domain-containing protein [Edaphobacter sp.]
MFCSRCGKQLDPTSRFCTGCGATVNSVPPAAAARTGQLVRPRENRMIGGVCAGFALHYGWDLSLVRVITAVIMVLSAGAGVVAYIAAWVIIPEAPFGLPVKSV